MCRINGVLWYEELHSVKARLIAAGAALRVAVLVSYLELPLEPQKPPRESCLRVGQVLVHIFLQLQRMTLPRRMPRPASCAATCRAQCPFSSVLVHSQAAGLQS